MTKNRIRTLVAGVAALLAASAVGAAGLTVQLPPETADFKRGPGVEYAERNCKTCHSADYIKTQPSGKPFAFWKVEVEKMKKLYGANIADADIDPIAKYLTKEYGDGK
ncbi:MAG TPA: cytochrome c [Casimicrobiaceae bacterium]|nr:cytochrome c [Casimicrobiaceae bacterium]